MEESYAESTVKKKQTSGTMAVKAGLIILIVLLVLFVILTGAVVLVPVAGIAVVVAFYMFPRFDVEYEVVFCDGQFDFDRISGNRKNLLKMDMEDIEIVAPLGHPELDNFKNISGKKDYSSGNAERTFVIIGGLGDKKLRVLFEPTEKMLECIYYKAPSKVKKTK